MKDTAAFVLLALSLFYYITKYRIAYFDRTVSVVIAAEAFLLLVAIGLFSFVALFSSVSKAVLSSLVVVVFGLFFDAVREKYPGRGLVACTATVIFLIVDASKAKDTAIIVIGSIYVAAYVSLVAKKAMQSIATPVYTQMTEMYDTAVL